MQTYYHPKVRENSSWTLFLCQTAKKPDASTSIWQSAMFANFLAPLSDASVQLKAASVKSFSRITNIFDRKIVSPENEWKVIAKHAGRAVVHLSGFALVSLCISVKWRNTWRQVPVWPVLMIPTIALSVQEALLQLVNLGYEETALPVDKQEKEEPRPPVEIESEKIEEPKEEENKKEEIKSEPQSVKAKPQSVFNKKLRKLNKKNKLKVNGMDGVDTN